MQRLLSLFRQSECRPGGSRAARERFSQHFVTVLTHADLIPLPVAFQSILPAGCFIFNTCSTLELSHRVLPSPITTPVVLFLPGAEKCRHSTENLNIPTVQLYLLQSSLRHGAFLALYFIIYNTHSLTQNHHFSQFTQVTKPRSEPHCVLSDDAQTGRSLAHLCSPRAGETRSERDTFCVLRFLR